MPRSHIVLLIAGLLALCFADAALARRSGSQDASRSSKKAHPQDSAAIGKYDYYVMALSWSPTYCQTHPDEEEQCGRKGYGFVLHGLWPQYENGGGPQRCVSSDKPGRGTISATLPFMPSKRLINHEWFAHGACTGLDPQQYFQTADRAFAALRVPDELKAPPQDLQMRADDLRSALKRANPGLADSMMSLHCSQGDLVEVRVCLDKDLGLRACGGRMRTGCPVSAPFTIPAAK